MSEVKYYWAACPEFQGYGVEKCVIAKDFDRVTAERDAARSELALANEKIDKALNRTTAIDHKGFIPGAMDAWKRPVPQYLPYDFSGSTSASTIQYCNGWNDSGSYWSAHAANLSRKVDTLQQRLTAVDERADKNASLAVSLAAEKYALSDRADVLEGRVSMLLRELQELINDDDGILVAAELSTGFVWHALQKHGKAIEAALKPAEGRGDHVKHYECIGKGGDYTIVAIAQGSGTLKGFNHYIYKNADGVHFVRDPEDFLSRMQIKP